MTCTRSELIAEALTFLGTPYKLHQSCKGAGCDCAGFCYAVWRNVGLLPEGTLPQRLSSQWYLHRTDEIIVNNLKAHGAQEIPLSEAKPGDVLTFQYGRAQSHMAFLLERNRVIHSWQAGGQVCIHPFAAIAGKFRKAWLVPGLVDD